MSDPDAVLRQWLNTHTTQQLDLPFPGRDYLRLQLFAVDPALITAPLASTLSQTQNFEQAMQLHIFAPPTQLSAGETLYLRLNDHPGELADNKGSVSVEHREIESP